jgi:hypothetical protein
MEAQAGLATAHCPCRHYWLFHRDFQPHLPHSCPPMGWLYIRMEILCYHWSVPGLWRYLAVFILWEFKAAWPILPPTALKNWTVVGASLFAGFTLMCNLFLATWLPVLYEAGRGVSSLHAGLLIIAFLLTVVVSQAVKGFIMSLECAKVTAL